MATPSDTNDADMLLRTRTLLQDVLVQHLRLIHALKQPAMGAAGPADGLSLLSQLSRSVGPDVLFEAARTALTAQEELLKFGSRQLDRLADAVVGPRRGDGHARIALNLRGVPGDEVVGRFLLMNPNAEPAIARFTRPSLRSDTGIRLDAGIGFRRAGQGGTGAPSDEIDLALREDARCELALTIPAGATGACYRGETCVVVGARVVGVVDVEVAVTATPPARRVNATGPPGHDADSTAFAVQNPRTSPAVVSLNSPLAFVTSSGESFTAAVQLMRSDPSGGDLQLGPHADGLFVVRIHVPDAVHLPSRAGNPDAVVTQATACVLLDAQPLFTLAVRLEVA